MSSAAILILACFYNFSVGLSFSSLYFKGTSPKTYLKPIFLFVAINLIMVLLGVFSGSALINLMDNLSLYAGGALIIVVALKTIIRGWKTRPLTRIYDISRIQTMIWLFIAMNIDTLLFCIAIPLIAGVNFFIIIPTIFASSLIGVAAGVTLGKRAPLLMPNIIELVIGIAMLIQGAVLFIF